MDEEFRRQRVGVVEVVEDQQHLAQLGQAGDQAAQALEPGGVLERAHALRQTGIGEARTR